MKKTKRKGTLLRKSKFIEKEYQEDIKTLTKVYQNEGFQNMSIVSDTTYHYQGWQCDGQIKYRRRQTPFFQKHKNDNALYSNDYLSTVLGISKI